MHGEGPERGCPAPKFPVSTHFFMGPLDLVNHLLNFVAPALVVAGLVASFSRVFTKKSTHPSVFWPQFAINFVVGAAVLAAGVVLLGPDGKMLTYLALVLATATSQWAQAGGWKK